MIFPYVMYIRVAHTFKCGEKRFRKCHRKCFAGTVHSVLELDGCFLANVNVLRYVCYMLSAVRLSSVCLSVCRLSSVTLVHPTQAVELFRNFFSLYDSSGTLLFWCQKSVVGDAPFPLKFAFKVTHPLSNSEISTNIGS